MMQCFVYSTSIMEALKARDQVENWSDGRLDELSGRVDDGFKAVDQRFNRVEQEVKDGFAKVDARLAETPTRVEMDKGFAGLRSEMNAGLAEVRSGYTALNRNLVVGAIAINAALIKFHG
jgi:hypothetical protein